MDTLAGGTSGLVSEDAEEGTFTLDLFKRPKTSDDVLSCHFVELTPQEPIHDDIPAVTFNLAASSLPVYTALDEIYVSLTAAITKIGADGKKSPVTYNDNVSPAARLCDTLWEKVCPLI